MLVFWKHSKYSVGLVHVANGQLINKTVTMVTAAAKPTISSGIVPRVTFVFKQGSSSCSKAAVPPVSTGGRYRAQIHPESSFKLTSDKQT